MKKILILILLLIIPLSLLAMANSEETKTVIEFQTTAEGLPFQKEQLDEIFNLAKNSIDKIITMY